MKDSQNRTDTMDSPTQGAPFQAPASPDLKCDEPVNYQSDNRQVGNSPREKKVFSAHMSPSVGKSLSLTNTNAQGARSAGSSSSNERIKRRERNTKKIEQNQADPNTRAPDYRIKKTRQSSKRRNANRQAHDRRLNQEVASIRQGVEDCHVADGGNEKPFD